jgi:endonuclease YncB( thermonuclease family)
MTFSVRSIRMVDGDTFVVNGLTVRIAGIDAPESKQPFTHSSASAGEASKRCVSHFYERMGPLRIYGQDMYGRFIGDVGELGIKAVGMGCAGLYPFATFRSVEEKWKYLRAYEKARRLKLGLWKQGGYRQPMLWRKTNRRSAGRQSRR